MHAIHAGDLLLVAAVRQPRDLDIARVLGWYPILAGAAPKSLRVDRLPFRQTAAFGEGRWMVRSAAPVSGSQLVRHAGLLRDGRERPGAHEPYFKGQLGPMETLPHPIRSERGRRFPHAYPAGDRPLPVRGVTELTITSVADGDGRRMLRDRLAGLRERIGRT
jgi:hypothetical protein